MKSHSPKEQFTLLSVSHRHRRQVMERVLMAWDKRCHQKGEQIYHSRHEGLGLLAEEYDELLEAIRGKPMEPVAEEATDCLVVLLHLLASIDAGGMKW